jgi:hypothetical protein
MGMSSVTWKPTGDLDISTDPASLPDGGMTRCKNLSTSRMGRMDARYGSSIHVPDVGNQELNLKLQGVKCITYGAYNTAENVFRLDNRTRYVDQAIYGWGIDAPANAPVVELGSGTGLTGAYSYKYTFCRKEGLVVASESNPSPVSNTVTATNDGLILYAIGSDDPQVTHARIYRTLTGATGSWYLLAEFQLSLLAPTVLATYIFPWELVMITSVFEINPALGYDSGIDYGFTQAWEYDLVSGLTYTETVPYYTQDWEAYFDAGTAYVAPFAYNDTTTDGNLGELLVDYHNRPPIDGVDVFGPYFAGQLFLIKDNLLHYSYPQLPEYWPLAYFIEVSPPNDAGIAGTIWNGQVFYFTNHRIYQVQGTSHGNYLAYDMKGITGTVSRWGIASVAGQGIFHIGYDGIYLFNGTDTKITQGNLDPIFRNMSVNGVPSVSDIFSSWVVQMGTELWFSYDDHNVIIFDLGTNRTSYRYYPFGLRYAVADINNDRILAGDENGVFYHLDDKTTNLDLGEVVEWEIQSKEFSLSTRAHFPRWCKWDVDATTSTSCVGSIILDGAIFQDHTITGNRAIKRRLVKEGNGQRAQYRVSGSGPVTIYAAEME